MDTKFVKNFVSPREVICCVRLCNYGFCWGARKFENGSFALRFAEGVDLYDALGQKLETQIEDVFVFKNGYRLQKQTTSSGWCLLRSDGEIILRGEKVEVCDDSLFALKISEQEWGIYQFSNVDGAMQLLTKCNAECVKLFRKKSNVDFVTALMEQGSVVLQLRHGISGVVLLELSKFDFFFPLFDGRFAVSKKQLHVNQHAAGCLFIEAIGGSGFDLYDDKLKLSVAEVMGITILENGMYLMNEQNEWKFFSANGKLLRDGIYHLSIYDAPDLKQCILFARTEDDGRVVFRLKDNGWVHVTYGDELRFWTPDGRSVEAEDGCNEPILF